MNNRKDTIKSFLKHPLLIGALLIIFIAMFGSNMWINSSNDLNNKVQDYKAQWSQVENVMQRRADLIPTLAASVKGEMHNEQKIFKSLARARTAYSNAGTAEDKMKASSQISKNIGALFNIIHEKYPKLESHEHVHELMVEIEGSENRISVERRKYNQKIQTYNQAVTNFPTSLVAQSQGLKPADYFKAESSAKTAPKVDLD